MTVDRPHGVPYPRRHAGPLTHAERLAATRGLLDVVARSTDPRSRHRVLREVAALNAEDAMEVVASLRHPATDDEPALRTCALEAYVDAVLALEPGDQSDLLPQVLPSVRDAVVRFCRDHPVASAAPGVGR